MRQSGQTSRIRFARIALGLIFLLLAVLTVSSSVRASTLAVIDPEQNDVSAKVAEALKVALSRHEKVLDIGLSDAAFRSFRLESPFNLDSQTARSVGAAVGCRFYVLVRSDVQRRSSFGREEYYEAHAAFFLVDSVTGALDEWLFSVFEEDSPLEAERKLLRSMEETARRLASASAEAIEKNAAAVQVSERESGSDDIRSAMPYRRLKPEYTSLADLYGVEATVDAEARIAADGTVLEVKIMRWAGYGLDESVISAVRTMQWRPAERKGEFLPMSVLLRYNFRDIENETEN
ncbi:MAG TPA: energy transducer TonB [Aridibacter sp.]|nr:energy transducer TonB [Aridibacter sp.]